ncbi:MAG: hypothetical protein IPP18_05445 [Rhodocyclaceae bacterium]|nr:hypothetical protein [Rhodocyclaceae bacterium]
MQFPKLFRLIWSVDFIVAIVILVWGSIYIGNSWSPSSYGYVLANILGEPQSGPAWGEYQAVRSDEWADVTPLIQATIKNDYGRYNLTSLYGEDLRINYGLPIHDWGFFFKPTMWLFGWVNPAYAYSFHWYALTVLFIAGYALLFRWMGAPPTVGYMLAASMYFTGFVQFWWNEKGSEFALFPWILLPFATRLPITWKLAIYYWVSASWLLTNFYPPVQIPLTFVGAVLLLILQPHLIKPKTSIPLVLTSVLSVGTVIIYLFDYLVATSNTVYPGGRQSAGGSDFLMSYWPGWLFPNINFGSGCIIPNEPDVVCEFGMFGMSYFFLGSCFLDYSRWRMVLFEERYRRAMLFLGVASCMILAWMFVPLPTWVGWPLLWNFVRPERMQFALGLLATCFLSMLIGCMGIRTSLLRLSISLITVAIAWAVWYRGTPMWGSNFVAVITLIPCTLLVVRFAPAVAHAALAGISLLMGFVTFATFNPLQSAWPIFNLAPNKVTQDLDWLAASNNGVLVVEGELLSAIGNGLGYKSLSHVTTTPHLRFWRQQFPDVPPYEFDTVFNRFSHIVPVQEGHPRLLAEHAVGVPVQPFLTTNPIPVRYVSKIPHGLQSDGHIDRVELRSNGVAIMGWAAWTGPVKDRVLEVKVIPEPAGEALSSVLVRSDLPRATDQGVSALNGFTLLVPLPSGSDLPSVCVVAYDTRTGRRVLLLNPTGVAYCSMSSP